MKGELKKFDAVLANSAEGVARILEYNEMLRQGAAPSTLPRFKRPTTGNRLNLQPAPPAGNFIPPFDPAKQGGGAIPFNKVPFEGVTPEKLKELDNFFGGKGKKDVVSLLEDIKNLLEADSKNPRIRINDAELA